MTLDAIGKALLRALSDGGSHSGTELAGSLGVSRSAVWKHLRQLEILGLEIAAVPGRGYRLLAPVELLDGDAIRAGLGREAARWLAALEIHDVIDSTNTALARAARDGAPAGSVCLAEIQTAGRGRMGRDWVSGLGANLCLSVLWRFEEPARVAGLSLAVGVAVARALAALGYPEVGLKWPNDVLHGERKLGGILLEMSGEAHGPCAVVIGLGLNRHLPARLGRAIDQDWIDLAGIPGVVPPPRNVLAAAVLDQLLPVLGGYAERGLAAYLGEWRRFHRLAGRAAEIQQGGAILRGRIEDVTAEGLLILRGEDGVPRRFASGDLRLRMVRE